MQRKLEAFLTLCERYESEMDMARLAHSKPYIKPIEDRITDALPTVEQIIRHVNPSLLSDAFGTADGSLGMTVSARRTRTALAILRDREEWTTNLAPDAPSLSADNLHPWIWIAAAPMWKVGQFKHAAQDACISLSDHLKTKAGSQLTEAKLVAQVFSPEPPTPGQSRLHFAGNRADENWKSQQRGLHLLAQGAFAGIRNIAAHSKPTWSEHEALEHPTVLSAVARWVDETQLVSA
jgi:hypothetical protein